MQRRQVSDLPQRREERVRGEQDWSWWDELGWELRLRKAEGGTESRIMWVQTPAKRQSSEVQVIWKMRHTKKCGKSEVSEVRGCRGA